MTISHDAYHDRVLQQLDQYRRELLDFSRRNALLNLKPQRGRLVLSGPSASELLIRLEATRRPRWEIFVPDEPSEDDDRPVAYELREDEVRTDKPSRKDVLRTCTGLHRRAEQEFLDRGTWGLFLALGTLEWRDPAEGTKADSWRSPLLLVPVELLHTDKRTTWHFRRNEDEIEVNTTLAAKLEQDFGVTLPTLDVGDVSLDAYLREVAQVVKDRSDWSVTPGATLGYFAFHKDAMYADIRDNAEMIAQHPVIRTLAGEADEAIADSLAFEETPDALIDTLHPPETCHSVLDADSTQRKCIIAARDGHSFVMDGPPGSGKSQTITNVISELIAAGKTVLFVSEKAAALDVVFNRLAERKLDQFVLPLHDHKATRKEVASAFGHALAHRPDVKVRASPSTPAETKSRRDALTSYADALNEPLPAFDGRPLQRLIGEVAKRQPLPHAPVPNEVTADAEAWRTCQDACRALESTWDLQRGDGSIWTGVEIDDWSPQAQQRIGALLANALKTTEIATELAAQTSQDLRLPTPYSGDDARTLIGLLEALEGRPDGVPDQWLSLPDLQQLRAAERLHADLAERRADARETKATVLGADADDATFALTPELSRQAETDVAALERAVQSDVRSEHLRALQTALPAVDTASAEVKAAAETLSSELGLQLNDPDLEKVTWLTELADRVLRGETPPAAWLAGPSALDSARADWDALRAGLEAERHAKAAASSFREQALELDLVAFKTRFEMVHRGLKKLGGAYRSDKQQLQQVVTVGWKDAVAQLDAAIAWQEARAQLDASVERHGERLQATWRGLETDVDDVDSAFTSATTFRDECGDQLRDWSQLARTIAAAADGGQGLHEMRRALTEKLAAFTSATDAAPWRDVRPSGPDRVSRLANELAPVIERSAELVEAAGAGIPSARATSLTVGEAQRIGAANHELAAIAQAVAEKDELLELLGPWQSFECDLTAVAERIEWAAGVRGLWSGPFSPAASERLVVAVLPSEQLAQTMRDTDHAYADLVKNFSQSRRAHPLGLLETSFDEATRTLEQLQLATADIPRLQRLENARELIIDLGLTDALSYCSENGLSPEEARGTIERSYLEAAVQQLQFARREAIGETEAAARSELALQHRQDDLDNINRAVGRVVEAVNARRPTTVIGPVRVLQIEAEKKRKHRPIRELLRDGQDAAQRLKPCFMMSPLSVSRFLPPDFTFDCVVFDEASQVRPSEAVVALYRAREAIIAGDQKQMPPTSFFDNASSDDDYVEDELDEFDSLLDAAKASAIQSLPLGWHYRSRHESLIAFSNRRYYDSGLLTFPSPVETSEDIGVEGYQVDGVYTRGKDKTNEEEAKFVVNRVFTHAARGTTSIGVVAFSEPQARLIDELLQGDDRWQQYPELSSENRLEGVFVKNLENVQGDERDVIIFSVGYGKDHEGNFSLNFGPVNQANGPRRLNVAITRARKRNEIVSSFAPHELAGSPSVGLGHLREYLEFANKRGRLPERVDSEQSSDRFDSPFEEEVARVLRSHGFSVQTQVGVAGYRIDLGVRDPDRPGRYAIGIECDGATYHSSRTARDRDRLRQQLLEGLGWQISRVWSTAWFTTRGAAERELVRAVEAAIAGNSGVEPSTPALDPVISELVAVDHSTAPEWAVPYQTTSLGFARSSDLTNAAAAFELRKVVELVVDSEGPIVPELLHRRVCSRWEVSITPTRRRAIDSAVDQLIGESLLTLERGTLWATDQQLTQARYPGDREDSRREVHLIPAAELELAVLKTIESVGVADRDELTESVSRLFGWSRRGARIVAGLDLAIEQLVRDGLLARDGQRIRATQTQDA